MARVRFRHTDSGEVRETDLIICRPEEWPDRPESKDRAWSCGEVDLTDELEESVILAVPTLFFALRLGHLSERMAGLKSL